MFKYLILIYLINSSEGLKFFEVIFDRIEVVQQDISIVEFNARVKKINKTRSIVGFVFYHEPFGNNFLIELNTLKKQGGEYRYLPYKQTTEPFCDVLMRDKYFYPDIAKNSDFPEDIENNCPLPARNYTLHGVTTNLENLPLIAAQSGEYGAELIFYKDGKTVAIYRAYCYINKV